MIAPMSEGTLSVVPVMNSITRMPQKRGRQRQDHDEGIAEILVVHHHQREHEDGGEQEPDAKIAEAVVHALDLADDLDRIAGDSFGCNSATILLISLETPPRSRP